MQKCLLCSASAFFFILSNYFVHIKNIPMAFLMILLTTFLIWETLKIHVQQTEDNHSVERRAIQTQYLTSFTPLQMPIFSVIPYQVQNESLSRCCICLDDLTSDVVLTPCSHSFHYQCLYRWLLHRNACPLCLKPIPILYFQSLAVTS